ncbi:MAG: sugar phosphate isomerase/epimerase [Chloroflexi bacterium]|nr:sugar phosphate isomerase/epimerase [Chloroflexota bacterium]
MKTSLALGSLGPLVTRFVPGGHRPELAGETTAQRVSRAVEGLEGYVDGYEFYYPESLNEDNLDEVRIALGDHDIYVLAAALHPEPHFARGGLTSPEPATRAAALRRTLACIDLAGELGANVIIWPGNEGYNYPFQIRYQEAWNLLIDALDEAAARCQRHGIDLWLEPKNSEPAMKVLLRNVSTALHMVGVLRERGHSNIKVNLDWQNVFMTGEGLAECAALLERDGALGHMHASSGWGTLDDKTMVGSLKFIETLELAHYLRSSSYESSGGRLGLDLYPYTEDGIAAVRRSVEQWHALGQIASRIDDAALEEARAGHDAVRAHEIVYAALTGD